MRNTDNSHDSIHRDTFNGLTALMRQFAVVDSLMGKILKQIALSGRESPLCDLSLAEIHFLSAVAEFAPINGTMLTQKIGLTKGGVSKMAARLASKGMIESERIEGNKKSQYYVLTADGEFACDVHTALHDIANNKIISSLSRYDVDELTAFNKVLNTLSTAIKESSEDVSANFRKYLADDGIHID
ncbi:MarR family transcriptional regulator [Desulfovibrio sp. Huiquan2017]|uniref:MarR family winged helix-turn-helix transcriptional regulator n=1 Tax=Desulfovibrio sp. Huiquan2017 TaxID=2816861 RepID=UPI001A9112DF|nr:MarR family transcriptional regulator [Desulfovibrio sp. Huiquan2017]